MDKLDLYKKMIEKIDELHFHGERAKDKPFRLNLLPNLSDVPHPTISLHREKFVRFWNDYKILVAFSAMILEKDPEKLSPIDLIAYTLQLSDEEDKSMTIAAKESERG